PVGHLASVTALTFSPDGKHLVSGADDGTVRLWHPVTGREVRQIRLEGKEVQGVAILRSGLLLSQCDVSPPDEYRNPETARSRIQLWDVGTGRERFRYDLARTFGRPTAFCAASQSMAFREQGKDAKSSLRLLQPETGKMRAWEAKEMVGEAG